ncbi:MAG: CHAT domain-containing protein, partial [Balneolaceae bacterium]
QSIAYLRQADDLLHDETDVRTYTRVKFELANYYKLAGELERSKEVLQEVLTEKSADLIVPVYLEIQLEMAWLELQTGNHTEARQRLREFHAHDISVVPFPVLVMAKTVEAKLYEFDGLHRQAEAAYAEAAERTFERTQNSADRESGYWTAEPEYLALFESYVNFLMGQRKYTDAIHILDQVKTINDAAITDNRLVVADRLTEEQLSRKAQIDQEMDRIRRQLFAASSANRLQLKTELEQLAAERNQILAGVSSAMRQQPPPVWALQNRLAADELVLHITEINNTYYIASIRKNEITLQKKEISSEVKEQLDGAVQSLVRGQANLHNLYSASQFLGIPELDPAIRSIIVFPDGHFHQLPLDVLPVQPPASAVSYGSASFLIEQADVRALNRLADLHRTNRASGFEHNFTGFGVSDFHNQQTNRDLMTLPNAPVEVHTITEALTRLNHKRVVVEQDATPSAFKELASGSRILHMASHSEVSESDPLFSRLHFSADPGFEGDPFLFAYELFDLNLQNDLIMLNSCESGSGRFLQGSGIMGISRALRYAGASSLVLNAWSVNDQLAAEFATLFYGYLNDGMTKSKALQQTKVDFIRTKNANPHFWGPYILNGDNAPLVPRPDVQIANIGMLFLFILGAVFVAVRRQRFH